MRPAHTLAALVLTGLLYAAAPATAQPAGSAPNSAPGHNILCEGAAADAVEPLPEAVSAWTIVLCTPRGQMLAARVENEVILWMLHGTAVPFMLPAVPPQFVMRNPQFPVDQLRFAAFAARPMEGEHRRLSLELWKRAFETPAVPDDLGAIVQLDARSVYEGTVYSLFFYLRDGTPRWLLICADRCNRSISIDVLQGAELDARVAEHDPADGSRR